MSDAPRHESDPGERAVCFGPFRLLPAQQLLLEGDAPVVLGGRAFDLLTALVARAGELVTKEELFAAAWPGTAVEESNLRAQVAALRKALRDGEDGNRYVATVPGRGYRFVGSVSQVSAGRVAGPAASARARPVRLASMVGREDVVQSIGGRLARRRFVTVAGPGGIGKTTVALAVADALADRYEHGVAFVDLAPLSDPKLVPSALATTLGLSVVSDDPTPGVVGFLAARRMLVVLDTCEHVVESAAVLAEKVLKGAPGVHLLATSREPLRAEGEGVLRLPPLDAPPPADTLSAREALSYPAVQLFVERASAANDGFELGDVDARAIAEICRRLDGIPLAIELVAGRVDAFGVRGVHELLDDRFRLLTQGRRTALPRHQTLEAALDWSYELLSEPERCMLRRLAIFSGCFTLETASALVGDVSGSDCEVIDAIGSLVTRSLVSTEQSGATSRYRLLDTTRAYALAKLEQIGEREAIARRHAEHFLALMERASEEWEHGRAQADWLASYACQIDNVRQALDWAFSPSGDASLGVRLTIAAIPLWFQLPLIEECFERVQQALLRVEPGPDRDAHARDAIALLGALGLSRALATGFAPDAVAAFARALETAEALGDTENRLGMMYGLWTCRFATGAHREGLVLGEKFAALAETSEEPADRLIGDRLIGISKHYMGEHAEALRHLARMLAHYRAPTRRSPTIRFQSDQRVLARATLARVLWLQGLPDRAAQEAQRTVEEARSSGYPISLYGALAQAECRIALLVGDLVTAERSVAMMREQSGKQLLGPWGLLARGIHGVLRIEQGDLDAGLEELRAAIAEFANSPHLRIDLDLLAALADGYARAGQVERGLVAIDEALARALHSEERWCMAELLRIKGCLLGKRSPEDAEALYQQSLDWARRQHELSWELRTATCLARAWHQQGRSVEARELLAPIYERFSEGHASADLVAARGLLEEL